MQSRPRWGIKAFLRLSRLTCCVDAVWHGTWAFGRHQTLRRAWYAWPWTRSGSRRAVGRRATVTREDKLNDPPATRDRLVGPLAVEGL